MSLSPPQSALFDAEKLVQPRRWAAHIRHYWANAPRPLFPKYQMFSPDKLSPPWVEWHAARGLDPDKPSRRPRLAAALRRAVISRDGYTCGLCGYDVESDDIHIDHIVPVSLGGDDALTNLQVAHSFCNISKGARVTTRGLT